MTSSTVMSRPLTSLAFVGQTSAHFPQFPHFARSSVETAPLMTAAPVGQIIWHAPQPVQRLAKKAPERKKSGIPDCCTRCSAADSLSGKPSSVCPDHPSLTSAEYCTPFPGSFPPPSFSAVPPIRPYTGTGGRRKFRCRQFRYFSMPQAPYRFYQTYSVRLMISFCTPRSRRVKYALKPATRTTRSLYSSG